MLELRRDGGGGQLRLQAGGKEDRALGDCSWVRRQLLEGLAGTEQTADWACASTGPGPGGQRPRNGQHRRRCVSQRERRPGTLRADQAMVSPKLVHGSRSARLEVASELWSSESGGR